MNAVRSARLWIFAAAAFPSIAFAQIENGDFYKWTNGKLPDKWTISAFPPAAQDTITIEQAPDGDARFLLITINDPRTEVHMGQVARDFLAGGKYRLSFEVRRSAGSAGYVKAGFEPGAGTANLKIGDFGKEAFGTGEWERFQAEFTIPENADLTRWTFQLRIVGGDGSYGLRNILFEQISR